MTSSRRSKLAWANGRLRRSLPIPRAFRQPLPPRPPREVQGFRARARLVAREPRHADARLPARFLGALEGALDGSAALLALPALWPPGLGVLRDVAPGRFAQPAGECESDPQGAVPAPARAARERRDAARLVRRDARDRDGPVARLRARCSRHRVARHTTRGCRRPPCRRPPPRRRPHNLPLPPPPPTAHPLP